MAQDTTDREKGYHGYKEGEEELGYASCKGCSCSHGVEVEKGYDGDM